MDGNDRGPQRRAGPVTSLAVLGMRGVHSVVNSVGAGSHRQRFGSPSPSTDPIIKFVAPRPLYCPYPTAPPLAHHDAIRRISKRGMGREVSCAGDGSLDHRGGMFRRKRPPYLTSGEGG